MPLPPDTETDPRFPSGPWRGYWEQGLIRGWMTLDLRFAGGVLQGHGRDCVGAFVMHGRYDTDTGALRVHKQFIGQHLVRYEGAHAGAALLGRWSMKNAAGADEGPFRLWPLARDEHERRALIEAKPEIVIAKGRNAGVLVG